MGSREKEQTTPHLSSLVVRPTDSGGGGAGVAAAGGAGGGSDYEPGEVRRDQPTYARSDRFPDSHGYRMRVGSVSPVRRRNTDRRYSPNFDHSNGPPHGRGFGGGRDPGRYRDYSPPYGRGREGGRFPVRGYDRHGFVPGSVRGEGVARNNPNVQPREGDWICSDPLCNNLNFARREYCNNCNRPRYAPAGSPRRGHASLLPITGRLGPSGPPMDRSPGRLMNGYRSPPRGWARDDPRDFRAGMPPPRYEGRFHDHPPLRRDRPDFPEDDYRDRGRFDRPLPLNWGHRDRGRETYIGERRLPSPPPPPLPSLPPRGQWPRDIRERSRSPIRDRAPHPKDYRRPMFVDRGRDDRRAGRDAF
nr:RNA-binding protein EWS-like [Ipomoea batatas]GME18922.1 RNA-binding protein EWS-like [Ipomoea batatas]